MPAKMLDSFALIAFFRTLSGQEPSREDLDKLLGIIQGTRKP